MIPKQDRERIVSLWENGMSIEQIRRVMPYTAKVYKATIAEMKANGEFPNARELNKDKIAQAVKDGITNPYELAQIYGVTVKTAMEYKRIYGGVSPRKRPARNYIHCARTNAIVDDLNEGKYTIAEIARRNGAKWQTVHKIRLKLKTTQNG